MHIAPNAKCQRVLVLTVWLVCVVFTVLYPHFHCRTVTSAFISLVFVEIGMLWLFHIFCSDAPIACPLLNLVRNCVVHSQSSVIRDPRYENVFTCANCSFWMSMRHAMPSLAITLVLSILMSRLYLRLSRSRKSTNSCSSASEVANRVQGTIITWAVDASAPHVIMVPWTHPVQHLELHLDCFRHFCTAHGKCLYTLHYALKRE